MTSRSYPFVALSLLLAVTGAGMITTLLWAIGNVFSGRPLLPPWPKRLREVPWHGFTIVAVFATWFAVNIVVSVGYHRVRPDARTRPAAVSTPPPASKVRNDPKTPSAPARKAVPPMTFAEQIVLISLINGILLVILPAGIALTSGARRADLGLMTESLGRDLKLGAVAFLAITPVVMAVNFYAQKVWKPQRHPLEQMLREGVSPGLIALAYISAVVLAPAVEEFLFRVVFQGWLRNLFDPQADPEPRFAPLSGSTPTDVDLEWSRAPRNRILPVMPSRLPQRLLPVVLTSVVFAGVHFEQMPAPLAIFPLSIVLGLLYETTGSLIPSFVLHALFNGFNTTLLVAALLYKPEWKP